MQIYFNRFPDNKFRRTRAEWNSKQSSQEFCPISKDPNSSMTSLAVLSSISKLVTSTDKQISLWTLFWVESLWSSMNTYRKSVQSHWVVNSPHKWPVTQKKFPLDDVIMFVILATPQLLWKNNMEFQWNWIMGEKSLVKCSLELNLKQMDAVTNSVALSSRKMNEE